MFDLQSTYNFELVPYFLFIILAKPNLFLSTVESRYLAEDFLEKKDFFFITRKSILRKKIMYLHLSSEGHKCSHINDVNQFKSPLKHTLMSLA